MTESAKPTCKFCWIMRYLLVVAAVLAGGYAYRTFNPPEVDLTTLNAELENATALPTGSRTVPNVALLGYDGKQRPALSFFEGKWTLAFFGYTYCPDICPAALASMAQAMTLVREQTPEYADTQILFVSIDPQRDTPERLKEYVEYFDPLFVGTTSSKADIDEITNTFGALYAMVGDTEGSTNYLVDHSSQIVLIGPHGNGRAILMPPHQPAQIASDLAILRKNLR